MNPDQQYKEAHSEIHVTARRIIALFDSGHCQTDNELLIRLLVDLRKAFNKEDEAFRALTWRLAISGFEYDRFDNAA